MAITSVFYDTSAGTPSSLVDETKWAKAHPYIGSSSYGVAHIADFKVTAHPVTPLTVNVAPGWAWGRGVWDESDSVIPVTCTAPGVGASRWDLICIHRDWTGAVGGPTTVTKVEGGTSRTLPAARDIFENTLGAADDQPLALVQWTYGSAQPTAIVDLRIWGGEGGLWAHDELVLVFLETVGSTVNINGTIWQKTIGMGELPSWVKTSEQDKISAFGFGGSLDGTPAAGQTGFLIQAGSAVSYTDAAGFASITFPRPFPNGLLTAIVINGDTSIDRYRTHALNYGIAGLPWDNGRKWGFVYSLAFANADGANQIAPNYLHRANWIALGW